MCECFCLVLVSVFFVVLVLLLGDFFVVLLVDAYKCSVGLFTDIFLFFLAVLRAYFVFVLQRFVRLLASLLLLPL